MPILKRLSDPEDEPAAGNGESRRPDRRAEPEIIQGRAGYARVSVGALRERIEQEVQEELAARSDILLDAQDVAARRALVREVGEYVLAVETVTLSREERDRLFDAAYSNLFSFGPLDALLADERVTELTADGHARLHIRRRMGPPEPVPSHFEDAAHLVRILERILTSAGSELRDDQPFVEIGVTLLDRPARLTLILPPLSPEPHVDVRLHPRQPLTLDSLLAQGALSTADADLLRALARSPHGVCIAGEAATGKTTLLQALLAEVPDPAQVVVVERAREVCLPEGMRRRAAVSARGERSRPRLRRADRRRAGRAAGPAGHGRAARRQVRADLGGAERPGGAALPGRAAHKSRPGADAQHARHLAAQGAADPGPGGDQYGTAGAPAVRGDDAPRGRPAPRERHQRMGGHAGRPGACTPGADRARSAHRVCSPPCALGATEIVSGWVRLNSNIPLILR